MKILIFGRGVIGAIYGWALEKAGHTVDFYVRPGRAAAYGPAITLRLLDARKRITGVPVNETWATRLREDLPADHDYDLIIVSVQHYRFAEAAAFLGPRVGKATVLVFNNFWTDPLVAAAALPASQLAWGFPAAGGGFGADGVLTGSLFNMVTFGTFGTEPTAREVAVRDLFRKSGFALSEQRDFKGWLWVHFATNAGLHAAALRGGTVSGLLAVPGALEDAVRNVRELLPVVTARGVDLGAHARYTLLFRLPPWLGARLFRLVLTLLKPVRLVVESHTNPEELRLTCRDMLDETRRLGISVPRLEAAEVYFPRV
ncbi:MAG: 2-dehydropantoate 2-reductase N-terminal domain-containing protein [Myxococcota bacterium]